jgi:hypothetical protein
MYSVNLGGRVCPPRAACLQKRGKDRTPRGQDQMKAPGGYFTRTQGFFLMSMSLGLSPPLTRSTRLTLQEETM